MPPRNMNGVEVGTRFGRWTVIGEPFVRDRGRNKHTHVLCKCDCGSEKAINASRLRGGQSMSCGCEALEIMRAKTTFHGYGGHADRHPLYSVWASMIKRCHRPKTQYFGLYGGRGIAVCDEWRCDASAFIGWALSNGWRRELQIDRIDNDDGYSPANCRFVTRSQNMRNSRANVLVDAFGETKCLVEWSEDARCVVCYGTLKSRIVNYGWEPERAITTKAQ